MPATEPITFQDDEGKVCTLRRFVPKGYEPAETVRDVLVQTKALLEDEARWMKGSWFSNQHPEVDPEDPFCNSWAVCLDGALGIIAVGVQKINEDVPWAADTALFDYAPGDELYKGAVEAVYKALEVMYPGSMGCNCPSCVSSGSLYQSIPNFNDSTSTTRTDVLNVLDKAVELLDATQEANSQ